MKEITGELRTEESTDNFSAWVKLGLLTNNCPEKVVAGKERKCRAAVEITNVEYGENAAVVCWCSESNRIFSDQNSHVFSSFQNCDFLRSFDF
jgi:hypothetical protein